jgi:hypothetical protein
MVLLAERTPPLGASAEEVGQGRRRRILAESINNRRKKFISTPSLLITTIAHLPSAMIAKMAFIAVGRLP